MVNCAAATSMDPDTESLSGSGHSGSAAVRPAADEPAIDLVHLSRQTFGDHELERELLALFEHQAGQFEARLSAPIAPGTSVWRAELVHTLKGSARAVGAVGVARAAEIYEEAMRAGGESATERDSLAVEIARARSAISELLQA